MWAQLIKMTVNEAQDQDVRVVLDQLRASEKPGSGHVRTFAMRDQKNPNDIYTLVVFESEEKAREREQDESRQADLAPIRELMGSVFSGPPEFTDLTMISDW
jgi:Antibiotic biosynthesis monooxygenase